MKYFFAIFITQHTNKMLNTQNYLIQLSQLQEEIFFKYCIEGNIKEAKKYSKNIPFETYKNMFYEVLHWEQGDLRTAKWFAKMKPTLLTTLEKNYLYELFNYYEYSCYYEHVLPIKRTNLFLQHKPQQYYIFANKNTIQICKVYTKKQQIAKQL